LFVLLCLILDPRLRGDDEWVIPTYNIVIPNLIGNLTLPVVPEIPGHAGDDESAIPTCNIVIPNLTGNLTPPDVHQIPGHAGDDAGINPGSPLVRG